MKLFHLSPIAALALVAACDSQPTDKAHFSDLEITELVSSSLEDVGTNTLIAELVSRGYHFSNNCPKAVHATWTAGDWPDHPSADWYVVEAEGDSGEGQDVAREGFTQNYVMPAEGFDGGEYVSYWGENIRRVRMRVAGIAVLPDGTKAQGPWSNHSTWYTLGSDITHVTVRSQKAQG